jgi:hypothetical protein
MDGSPAYRAVSVSKWIDEEFPDSWIGRDGPVAWLPRSPTLCHQIRLFGDI